MSAVTAATTTTTAATTTTTVQGPAYIHTPETPCPEGITNPYNWDCFAECPEGKGGLTLDECKAGAIELSGEISTAVEDYDNEQLRPGCFKIPDVDEASGPFIPGPYAWNESTLPVKDTMKPICRA